MLYWVKHFSLDNAWEPVYGADTVRWLVLLTKSTMLAGSLGPAKMLLTGSHDPAAP